MAVERMKMLSVVARIEDMNDILFEVLDSEALDMVDAMTQLAENSNIYSLEDNVDMVVDLNNLGPFPIDTDVRQRTQEAQKLVEYFHIKDLSINSFEGTDGLDERYRALVDRVEPLRDEYEKIHNRLDTIAMFKQNMALFENVDVDLTKIRDMKYFTARFGRLEKSARVRLKSS